MGQVWFGTKEYMQWIPAPAVDIPAGKQGFAAAANFTNGGAWVRRSKTAAKQFSMTWNMKRRADAQAVQDYADGIYGDGYIYYCNPFAMDRNMLPSYWATPFLNCYDGPVVVDEVRPELINNGTIVNGYPLESAQYELTSTSNVPYIFVPIPPGYTAHIGAHGELVSGDASVTYMTHATPAGGATASLTLLSKTDPLTNTTVAGNDFMGVTISMAAVSASVLTLDGLIVQVLPNGVQPPVGAFVSGQGTSGMSFVNQPAVSEYSAALDMVGVSADLVETEAWAWQ